MGLPLFEVNNSFLETLISAGARLHVQVVGGLVQQQDVGVAQADGRENHARFLSTWEMQNDEITSRMVEVPEEGESKPRND